MLDYISHTYWMRAGRCVIRIYALFQCFSSSDLTLSLIQLFQVIHLTSTAVFQIVLVAFQTAKAGVHFLDFLFQGLKRAACSRRQKMASYIQGCQVDRFSVILTDFWEARPI